MPRVILWIANGMLAVGAAILLAWFTDEVLWWDIIAAFVLIVFGAALKAVYEDRR